MKGTTATTSVSIFSRPPKKLLVLFAGAGMAALLIGLLVSRLPPRRVVSLTFMRYETCTNDPLTYARLCVTNASERTISLFATSYPVLGASLYIRCREKSRYAWGTEKATVVSLRGSTGPNDCLESGQSMTFLVPIGSTDPPMRIGVPYYPTFYSPDQRVGSIRSRARQLLNWLKIPFPDDSKPAWCSKTLVFTPRSRSIFPRE